MVKRDFTFWIVLVTAAIALMALALVDFAWSWLGTWPIAPAIYVRYAWPWLLIMLPFVIFRFNKQKLGVVLALPLAMALIFYTPWTTRKTFLRHLSSIRAGMDHAEVERIMRGYIRFFGEPEGSTEENAQNGQVPHATAVGHSIGNKAENEEAATHEHVYKHSNSSAFYQDLGTIKFQDGNVKSVEFSAEYGHMSFVGSTSK